METARLRRIQQPSRVQTLLEAFVLKANVLPEGCYHIRDRSALPAVVQRVVIEAIRKDRAWCCWSDDHRIWLFTGEMSLPLSRERGAPVLQVNFYCEGGECKDTGLWIADKEGSWVRCVD